MNFNQFPIWRQPAGVSDESSLGRFGEQVAFYVGLSLSLVLWTRHDTDADKMFKFLSHVYIVYCPMHWMEALPLEQTLTSISIVDMSIKCQDQNNIVLTQKGGKYSLFSVFCFFFFFSFFLFFSIAESPLKLASATIFAPHPLFSSI